LGLGECIIELNCDDNAWRAIVENSGHQVRIKQTEQQQKNALQLEMRIRPFRLRWPLWDKLQSILCSLELYTVFRNGDDETKK